MKSISFGESKKSAAASGKNAPASTSQAQKKNIVSTPAASVTKSTIKAVTGRKSIIPDKQIIIDLEDLLPHIPAQFLKSGKQPGSKKELHFNAYDLLQGLASGKATVPLSRIVKLAPDFFTEPGAGDATNIELPLQKIVPQIGAFPCRPDQLEVQFPLLDLQYSNLVVEKAASVAARAPFPGAVAVSIPDSRQKTSLPQAPHSELDVLESLIGETPQPDHAGAIEEMLLEPVPPAKAMDLPMEIEQIPVEIEPLPELPAIDDKVTYSLAALLPNMPKPWLAGDLKSIDSSARITVPFRLVEAQLASGRVELAFADFIEGVPEDFRKHFSGGNEEGEMTRIQIPLNEVFQNLPGVEPLPPSTRPAAVETVEDSHEEIPKVEETAVKPELKTAPVENTQPAAEEMHKPAEQSSAPEELKAPVEPVAIKAAPPVSQEPKVETPASAVEESKPAPAVPEPAQNSPQKEAEKPAELVAATNPAPQPPVVEVTPHPPEVSLPVYKEPSAPSQIAATITPPKIHLQHVSPPAVFAKETPPASAENEMIEPEPEPGKILAFEGTSLTFNPNAVEDLFMTDGKFDARKTVEHISRFPGTKGVALTLGSETTTEGDIPQNFNAANTANAASILFQSLESPADQAGNTPTRDVTLRHDGFSSTWFKQRHILLGILHTDRSLEEAMHNKLVLVTGELADLH